MHATDMMIPNPTRSIIRSQLYRTLREYAAGGNHRAIDLIKVFLRTVDYLVEEGVLPKRFNDSRYISLADADVFFPNYELPDYIVDFIRQLLWEQFVQGVLAPSAYAQPVANAKFHIFLG